MVIPAIFKTTEDLYCFSELASKEDFNIYISTPAGQLDAKSVLGLFAILNKEVNIVAPDHVDPGKFYAFLNKLGRS